jgi:hypothetical protein
VLAGDVREHRGTPAIGKCHRQSVGSDLDRGYQFRGIVSARPEWIRELSHDLATVLIRDERKPRVGCREEECPRDALPRRTFAAAVATS